MPALFQHCQIQNEVTNRNSHSRRALRGLENAERQILDREVGTWRNVDEGIESGRHLLSHRTNNKEHLLGTDLGFAAEEFERAVLFDKNEVTSDHSERLLRTIFARSILLRPVVPSPIQHNPIGLLKVARQA
jgi:hypothetical protein